MKLLFDQNLPAGLVGRLADLYPGSSHVKSLGMDRHADASIWEYARDQGYVIVSKDADFQQRSLLFGAPPKFVWLRVGNCPSSKVESLLRTYSIALHTFEADQEQSYLIVPASAGQTF